jgi:hypothetical protein
MSDDNRALVLDLVEWVAARPRDYAEVMEAWRTSCPRLTIWEDALDAGYLARESLNGASIVSVTPLGRALLERERACDLAAVVTRAAGTG